MPHRLRGTLVILGAAAALAQPLPADAQERSHGRGHGAEHGHAAEHGERPPLLPGLGTWSWRITTHVPAAQQYFDQGLRLAYAFNHDEAKLSFEEALRLDPSCAMCAWGIAYALSPNINLPMPPEAETGALDAVRLASSLAAGASARERDLVAAMAHRFGSPPGENRAARDSACPRDARRRARVSARRRRADALRGCIAEPAPVGPVDA